MTDAPIDTVVVGGGVAGLTAARLVHGAGRRVVVLEARDRVGGRLHSDRTGAAVTDLGASWIHGVDGNPLADAVRAFGMREVEFTVGSYQPDGRPIAYYGPDAVRLTPAAASAFADDVHAFDAQLARTIAASAPGESYEQVVDRTLVRLGWAPHRAARVREFLLHRSEEQYGVHAGGLDAHGLDDDRIDGIEVVFPDGYDALATHLAEGLDVRLGQEVSRVEWSDAGAAVTVAGTVLRAEHVIVTVPVGVLKSEAFAIEPPLPSPVAEALQGLEMNAFEKVFLRFDEAFWDDDVYAVRRQGDGALWWHSWYDLTGLHGMPTLLTFAAGPAAIETRTWDDEAIAASVLAALGELYGDRVPAPTSVVVTRWQDDPFARGSYAYLTPGATTADHDLLATPIGGGVLHLAGEATWTDDPATVTAALRSGHRAAERVLGREISFGELWA
ncbi:MAG TPA: NAD(P)/FAD-dependent oxidoreductase [Microbacterium sp.]|uniref:flavin monoamine oxidase family protein n=1 Tax=Microbacterium sp. TaxID=51671 RepID=UPI002B47917A|nr:NAD(P)/FAD-dependent oxidoreductase [Microbacterium sp.]HKT56585.1 NAD(P)/FAD-dependent oxidoreductase [Microbacterium sp.]